MKILFATSEAGPFIRTGGLGDVAGALPIALQKEGMEVAVVLPLYQNIPEKFRSIMEFIGSVYVPVGWRKQYAGLFTLSMGSLKYFFIDNEYYFKRNELYGHFDDGERFAFFSRAVLEIMPLMGFYPDVIHVNDWQTSLIPVMLDCFYRQIRGYENIKTVLTIHNIEFQGAMDKFVIGDVFGLPERHASLVEYKNDANMLKGGIECANAVTTVSRTYAEEIMHPYYAYGLESILSQRKYKIHGIVNGIDTDLYNPATDKFLFENYDLKTVEKRKACKEGLQRLLNLPVVDKPILSMVTRLTSQKGIDLVMNVIEDILYQDIQMVVLGTGDWKYEKDFRELQNRFPNKLSAIISFSQDIASKIYSGCDMFLMPSKYEPCGLSQLMAMRYGNVPIVRETGGLKDTVIPYNPTTKTGTGFTFKSYNAHDMLDAVHRALAVYYNPTEWAKVRSNAMSADYSWNQSAKEYINLYKSLFN